MDTNTIVTILSGAVILICIIVAIVIRYKSNPSAIDKESAKKFLDGLSDTFYDKIMEIINNIDFSKYNSLVELEADVLNTIYETIWNYVEEELKDAAKTDILTALALKVLNKDFVDKFVEDLINKLNIEWKLEAAWSKNHNFDDKVKEIQNNDVSEFTGNDYVEDSSSVELEPATEEKIPEEELKKLIPQSDDEEVLDPENDNSVEVVDDDSNVTIDSKGRKRDKKTGRFV